MMTKEIWLSGLLTVIREMGDAAFQDRIWRNGEGPEVSSWEEAMNRLYDDYLFDQVIAGKHRLGLTEEQHDAFSRLDRELTKFGNEIDESPDPAMLLDSPEWPRVREVAKDVLKTFGTAH